MWDEIYKIKHMNYRKVYESIILKAFSENRKKIKRNDTNYVYYESHHITPKCLGGNNDSSNLILLTSREHYLCHKLLTYMYKGNRKLACAFHKMTYGISNKCQKSSRDYAYAIELIKNVPISEETRNKKRNSVGNILAKIGDLNPAKRNNVKELIAEKLKRKFIGEKNPMSKSSRKRDNLLKLKEDGVDLKGDTHEYLRRKIKCIDIETNDFIIFDGVQNLLKQFKINKRKYYAHLKDQKPLIGKYMCIVM